MLIHLDNSLLQRIRLMHTQNPIRMVELSPDDYMAVRVSLLKEGVLVKVPQTDEKCRDSKSKIWFHECRRLQNTEDEGITLSSVG